MNRPVLEDLAVVSFASQVQVAHMPFEYIDSGSPLRPGLSLHTHIPSKPQFDGRIGGLYKPIKRYLRSIDQKVGRQIVAEAHHRRTMSLASPTEYKKNPAYKAALRSRIPVRAAPSAHDVNQQSSIPFPITVIERNIDKKFSHLHASSTFPEGMLHPASPHTGHQNHLGISLDNNPVIWPEDAESYSRVSNVASPASTYSRTPSFIRPISSFLAKSIDGATEVSWFPRTVDNHLTSSGPTTRSRESSFHSSCSRNPSPYPWKSPQWTKVLNGYVSPRNTSRLFQPLKKSKSKAASLNESYIYTRGRRNTIFKRDINTGVASRESDARDTHFAPSQGQSSCEQDVHLSCDSEAKAIATVSSSKFILSVAVSHALLFCIIPPRYVIGVGGGGMLFVYIVLLLSLASLCWTALEEDVYMRSSATRRPSVHVGRPHSSFGR